MPTSYLQPGVRVIRGPDWQSKKIDGGPGHAGTLIYLPKAGIQDDKVVVIWDNGREDKYRAGQDDKFDLRILDNAQIGVHHSNIVCDGCKVDPIPGIRWKCVPCHDFDLCTQCYMAGVHDRSHTFLRMDTPNLTAVTVPARSESSSIPIYGTFKGAKVLTGQHWEGHSEVSMEDEGEVKEVVNFGDRSPRGAVRVFWHEAHIEVTCRVGAEGCVDVVYAEKAPLSNYMYYTEHLPVVEMTRSSEVIITRSDKVQVFLSRDSLKSLQDNEMYGGWNEKMKQCITETGTVVSVLYSGRAVRVQYEDSQIWTINRLVITRLHSFSKGDVVRVLGDINTVQELQSGHGGWIDGMASTLGQMGRIIKVDSDGDLRLKFKSKVWVYSPVACEPVKETMDTSAVPALTTSETEDRSLTQSQKMELDVHRLAEVFAHILQEMQKLHTDSGSLEPRLLLEYAAKGELKKVKDIVKSHPDKVNQTHKSKTALQMASYYGRLDVVRFLLENKADVCFADDEGDTALHYAAIGKEEGALKLLLEKGANKDAKNQKGQTSLHITVGKGLVSCVQILVSKGSSPNIKDDNGYTAMHVSISTTQNQSEVIDCLFKSTEADFTTTNAKGLNVMQYAVLKNCKKAFDLMMKLKPDVCKTRMSEDYTTLHIAAVNDHMEIAHDLIKVGVDIDAQDKKGMTALMLAVIQSQKRMVELLLTYGCKVDMQDNAGNTALHLALIRHKAPEQLTTAPVTSPRKGEVCVAISCMMLEAKAKIDIKNKDGKTPLDLCADKEAKEFIMRLHKHKMQSTKRGIPMPSHWASMTDFTKVTRVTLDTADSMQQKEMKEVEFNFHKTLPNGHIVKVERVQNAFLWEHYSLKRRQMEHDYGTGCTNERDLFHGTRVELIDVILQDNLDHRLAGTRVGAILGQGSYFAESAKYSDAYATRSDSGHKYMLQCRVLTGKFTTGQSKYKRPPPIDDTVPHGKLYDSCVDDIKSPRIFCVFDKNQYYPEYVVEYKS